VLRFDVNDHVPGEDLLPVAEELMHALTWYPNAQVRIVGYTDATGLEHANMDLSAKRANAVRKELVRLGLPASRCTTVAKGSSEPAATNATEEGRALNRRVEIELVGATE
jgi:outer membrane protein OmpA-like peptidoglycan-associated protein